MHEPEPLTPPATAVAPESIPPASDASAAVSVSDDAMMRGIVFDDTTPVFEPLHPAARWSMAIGPAIGFFVPYIPLATTALVAWNGPGGVVKFGLFVLGAVVLLTLVWMYSGARFRAARFALTDDSLRIRRGVFWHSETLVPRSRVQHTDLNRGPIDRQFGMATLKVYTAGTKLASVSLDGLPEARAVELRDALVSDADDAL